VRWNRTLRSRRARSWTHLDELTDLLDAQGANAFRVNAYRHGAMAIAGLPEQVSELYTRRRHQGSRDDSRHRSPFSDRDSQTGGNRPAVDAGNTCGAEWIPSSFYGRFRESDLSRPSGCITIWGQTHWKRLKPRRMTAAWRAWQASGQRKSRGSSIRWRRGRDASPTQGGSAWQAPVEELLDVDREYLEAVQAGTLPTVAPRRFNPEKEAWLPILHTQRTDRHYTALFSNTARAHQSGMTHDWVILYQDGESGSPQCTAITSRYGPLEGPANRPLPRGRVPEYFERLTPRARRGMAN